MMKRNSERGNIFFMLFGAVALVGVVAAATSTLMRGPLSTVVNVNARAKADTQMQIAAKLAMVRASQQAASGDCDSDGNVEPIPATDASPKPLGGGQLPASIGASQQDPWGNAYGYCVWDIGTKNNDPTCAVAGGEVARLKGDYNNNYPVMVIVSAGPDRTFQTQCNDWVTTNPGNDPNVNNIPTNYVGPVVMGQHLVGVAGDVIYKPNTSDDIMISFSYDQAAQVAGGLWSLTKVDPNAITTDKKLDIQKDANFASTANAKFQGAANFDAGSKLDLGFGGAGVDKGGLFFLPDQFALQTCNSANNGTLRLFKAANHNSLEVCDGLAATPAWVPPSSSGISVSKIDDLTDAVGGVPAHPNLFLGDSTGALFTSASAGANNVGVGINSFANLSAASIGNIAIGGNTGNVLTSGTRNILIGSQLEVPGAATSGYLSIGNMIFATGMNNTGTTASTGNVGIGTATPNVKLEVAGTVQGTQFQFNSSNALAMSGGDITLSYSGTNQLFVNGNGLGVGVTPTHKLDVDGDAYAQRFVSTFSSASTAPSFTFGGDINTGISHPAGGVIGFTLSGSEKARLTSTGLGIGTTPTVPLDVVGAGAFTTSVTAGTAFQFGSSNGMYNQSGNISFNTAGVPRVYVTGSGLGVGLATPMVSIDAAGAIRPGTMAVCDSTNHGAIRYGSGDALEYCSTDDAWYSLVASGGGGGAANLWTNNTTYISRANAAFINASQTLPLALASAGSRFFWYPDKASFRAGGTSGAQWSDANIGIYSNGLGFDTQADGAYSFAAGHATRAGGTDSVALGRDVIASGANSFAFGLGASGITNPTVTGTNSFGIFMGNRANTTLAGNNTMALLGGKFLIDAAPGASPAISGALSLDVNGDVGAVQYCDSNGNFCFTPEALTSGSVGVFEFASVANVVRLNPVTVLNYSSTNYVFGSPQLADDGDATHRNRLYYYKSGGAFRVGGTSGTQWDTVGNYSNGLGYDTVATGNYSTAIGQKVSATGLNSVGFGLGAAAGAAPIVSGTGSYGVFMGDQSGVNFASGNTFGIFGGRMVIDPKNPATQLTARGVLDLGAATDAMVMPVGTTVQRPGATTSVNGMIRYNTDNGKFEAYQGGLWLDILTSGGGAVTAAGANNQIQFNSGGFLGAMSGFTWDRGTNILFVSGSTNMGVANTTNGDLTVARLIKVVPGPSGVSYIEVDNTANSGASVLNLKNSAALGRTWAIQVGGNNNAGGNGTQISEGNLQFLNNGTTGFVIMGSSGNFGLGNLIPVTKLEVPGTIKISDGGEVCNSTYKGAIRYTSVNTLQYCNSIAWTSTASSGTNVIAIDDLSDAITKYTSGSMYLGSGTGALATASTANNTALGSNSMQAAVSGADNTAFGAYTLAANTSGYENVAIGSGAMDTNTTGRGNVAIGVDALEQGTGATFNVAIGQSALQKAGGQSSVAIGAFALSNINAGQFNVAMGQGAGIGLTTSSYNTAIGNAAMGAAAGDYNSVFGAGAAATMTGANNTLLGYGAGATQTTGDYNIAIGSGVNFASTTASNQLNIGNLLTGNMSSGLAYISSNAAIMLPVGTTLQRPAAGVTVNGMIRYNNQSGKFEGYQGGTWQDILTGAIAGGAAAPDRGIQFNSGSSFYAVSNFTYTSAGRLGVGVTNPTSTVGVGGGMAIGLTYSSGTPVASNNLAVEGTLGVGIINPTQGLLQVNNVNSVGATIVASRSSNAYQASTGYLPAGALSNTNPSWSSGLLPASSDYSVMSYNGSTTSYSMVIGVSTPTNTLYMNSAGNVGIGTASPVAQLDISGTGAIVVPRGTTVQQPTPAVNGMLRYNSSKLAFEGYQNGAWLAFASTGATSTSTAIDDLTDAITNYTVNHTMYFGSGVGALNSGQYNTITGDGAFQATGAGTGNTAYGYSTLRANTSAIYNTAIGALALQANTIGNFNNALGVSALQSNVGGTDNTGIGFGALSSNSSGNANTAVGNYALQYSTIGVDNVAVGYAVFNSATGQSNTGIGTFAGLNLTTGNNNIAIGASTLFASPTGNYQLNIGNFIKGDMANGLMYISGTGALQLPVGTTLQTPSGVTALNGMIRYDSNKNKFQGYQAGTWQDILTGGGGSTTIDDLADAITQYTSAGTIYMGSASGLTGSGSGNTTLGYKAMQNATVGGYNVAIGTEAMSTIVGNSYNTAIGYQAMQRVNSAASGSGQNVGIGTFALQGSGSAAANTGTSNVAVGYATLSGNSSGSGNFALGSFALTNNTTGGNNAALGNTAMQANTTGNSNVAVGGGALNSNVTKQESTAVGYSAMLYADNAAGAAVTYNTAFGAYALRGSTTAANNTGTQNTAVGHGALLSMTSGTGNTGIGYNALSSATWGAGNVVVGSAAGQNMTSGGYNVALGTGALSAVTTSNGNIAIGFQAANNITTGGGNIVMGFNAKAANPTGNFQLNIGDLITGDMNAGLAYISSNGAIMLPVGTTGQRPAAGVTVNGMIRYNSGSGKFEGYQGGTWQDILTSGGGGTTAAGVNTNVQFNSGGILGASTGFAFDLSTGMLNLSSGYKYNGVNALRLTTQGNPVIGNTAMSLSLSPYSVAVGKDALSSVTTEVSGVAVGSLALANNTVGTGVTAVGTNSLLSNVGAADNTAIGYNAMTYTNSVAGSTYAGNTAVGSNALKGPNSAATNTGSKNTVIGAYGLSSNTTGSNNIAVGETAMLNNTTGSANIVLGVGSGSSLTTGSGNLLFGSAVNVPASNTSNYMSIGNLIFGSGGFGTGTAVGTGFVGIRTATPRVTLDVVGTDAMMIPAGLTAGRPAASAVANGMIRYNTTSNNFEGYQAGSWLPFASGGGSGVVSVIDDLADAITQYSSSNMYLGSNVGSLATTGAQYNTALGVNTMQAAVSGMANTAFGESSLTTLTAGGGNTAYGADSLGSTTTGSDNVAVGLGALTSNKARGGSTAVGMSAMSRMSDSTSIATTYNTAIGWYSMLGSATASNNSGVSNTAVGAGSMMAVTSGSLNVAVGNNALTAVTSGTNNTALGTYSVQSLNTGSYNIGVGVNALDSLQGGVANIAIGNSAGANLTTGSGNLIFGSAINMPANSTSNYMSIGNLIFGSGGFGTGTTVGNGFVGIRTASPRVTFDITGTDAMMIPAGLTANRPGSTVAVNGMMRYNTSTANFEGYQNGSWLPFSSASVSSTNAAGANTQVQFNSGGVLGASANYTWNNGTNLLSVQGKTNMGTTNSVDGDLTVANLVDVVMGLSGNAQMTVESSADTGSARINLKNTGASGKSFFVEVGGNNLAGTSGVNVTEGNFVIRESTGLIGLSIAKTTGYVAFGSSNAQAAIDMQGVTAALVPRGLTAQRPATGINGMIRYNASSANFEGYQNGSWLPFSSGTAAGVLAIDDLTDAITQYSSGGSMYLGSGVGVSGVGGNNTALGTNAMATVVNASQSTAIGYEAMRYTYDTASAYTLYNTAIGFQALRGSSTASSNTGRYNTAIGWGAMYANTTGAANAAIGMQALQNNTTGGSNTAVGNASLNANTVGNSNTAIGSGALYSNVAKVESTAIGINAMQYANSNGGLAITYNTAIGANALQGSTTASSNIGTGNTAIGHSAILNTTSGSNNTAIGAAAGKALTTGSNNLFFGSSSGANVSTGSSNIMIGTLIDAQVATASNQMSIGNLIFASGGFGTGTSVGSGFVGIRTAAPRVTLDITGTDAMMIPAGLTANRPGSTVAVNGMMRYNTSTANFEGYQNGSWLPFSSASAGATSAASPDRGIQFNSGGLLNAVSTFTYTSAGRVGIGTASPTALLEVNGTAKFNGDVDVSGTGNINAASPTGQVNIQSYGGTVASFRNTAATFYQNLNVVLSGDTPTNGSYHIGDGSVYTGTGTGTYYGVQIAPSLSTFTNSGTYYGLRVAVPAMGGTAYSAAFTGGNVGIGTTTPTVSLAMTGTDAVLVPAGTLGQRPTGINGMIRYNSSSANFEGYQNGSWLPFSSASVGATSAAGSPTQIQYNSAGIMGANSKFTFDPVTNTFNVQGVSTFGTASSVDGSITMAGNLNIVPNGGGQSNILLNNPSTNGVSIVSIGNTGSSGQTFELQVGGNNAGGTGGTGLNEGNLQIINTSLGTLMTVMKSTGYVAFGSSAPQANVDMQGVVAALVPRGLTAQRPATGINGMIRYNTSLVRFEGYQNGSWLPFSSAAAGSIGAIDDLTDAIVNYASSNMYLGTGVGTTTTSGAANTAMGVLSMQAVTSGFSNIALGRYTLNALTAGSANSGIGEYALSATTTGSNNTANGYAVMSTNVAGSESSAYGYNAMKYSNSSSSGFVSYNTAIGAYALQGSTTASANTGNNNTALGHSALKLDTTGSQNTAVGVNALSTNAIGNGNVAIGHIALTTSTGDYNTAVGHQAMSGNIAGANNTALGENSLAYNVGKWESTAIGFNAMYYADSAAGQTYSYNTALGAYALRGSVTASANTGTGNTAIGHSALLGATSGSNNVAIGGAAGKGLTTGSGNLFFGSAAGSNLNSGSSNIMIGTNIDAQVATASSQLSIGNLIFASGGFGTGTTVGTGFVGIRTATPRVSLDIVGTDAMMIPAGNNSTNRPAASAVANGMIRYNTTNTRFEGYQNGSWLPFSSAAAGSIGAIDDLTDAVVSYTSSNMYLGTGVGTTGTTASWNTGIGVGAMATMSTGTANVALGAAAMASNTTGYENVAVGYSALNANNTGYLNVAIGRQALAGNTNGFMNTAIGQNALQVNLSGSYNTAIGRQALTTNSTGNDNLAIGTYSMFANTIGTSNVALGSYSLYTNVGRQESTAIGYQAMQNANSASSAGITYNTALGAYAMQGSVIPANNTGTNNTAVGHSSLNSVTSGSNNTAVGYGALAFSSSAISNTAVGSGAMQNTTGSSNTAVGTGAMLSNLGGGNNSAFGAGSLDANTTGSSNIAIGTNALSTITTNSQNTVIGVNSLLNATGSNNIALGFQAGDALTTGASNILIGFDIDAQVATANSQMSIGNLIFASGGFGTGTSVGAGYIGIRTGTPRVTMDIVGTDAMMIPAGNNSTNRPAASAVANGMIRYNTTDTRFEGYQNGSWLPFSSSTGGSASAAGSNLQVQFNNGGVFGASANMTFSSATNALSITGKVSVTDRISITPTGSLSAPSALALSNLSDVSLGALTTGYVLTYNGTNWAAAASSGGGTIDALSDAIVSYTSSNMWFGTGVGAAATTGSLNTSTGVGSMQGVITGNGNSAYGWFALRNLTSGTSNVAVGNIALGANTTGIDNTAVGSNTLQNNISGISNVAVGQSALNAMTSNGGTAVGAYALQFTTGTSNTALGYNAGNTLTTGTNNIFVGNNVQSPAVGTSNFMTIGNLIFASGGFGTGTTVGTGFVGIKKAAPVVALDVVGDIQYTGVITDVSDRRLKKDILPLSNRGSMLDRVSKIGTYSFVMKDDPKGTVEFGVMAQEMKDVFPELVKTDYTTPQNYMSVNYMGLIAPLVQSTKELKAQNDNLKSRLAELEAQQKETYADIESLSRDIKGMKAYTGYGIGRAGMDSWMMLLIGVIFGGGAMTFAFRAGSRRRQD